MTRPSPVRCGKSRPIGHDPSVPTKAAPAPRAPVTAAAAKATANNSTTHRPAVLVAPFSLSLAKSQPQKSEATSDNEGDPARLHRYRPVSDDDSPLRKNPRHHGEIAPATRENSFASMSHHPKLF